MNYVRYVVVLIAAFFLIIPAFSIPDDGHSIGCSDNQQKTFDNQNPMMGHDDQQQIGPKSMMGNDGKKIVCLTVCKVIDGGNEQAGVKSMMGWKGQDGKDKTCGCQNAVKGDQGQDGRQNSWNDDQQKACGCHAGQEQAGVKSMMGEKGQDGRDKTCGCQNAVKDQGQDGRQNSWNNGQQNACGCQSGQEHAGPRSMMGGNEKDGKDKTCGCQNLSDDNKKSWNGESEQNCQHNMWNHSQESWNGNSKQDGQENIDES